MRSTRIASALRRSVSLRTEFNPAFLAVDPAWQGHGVGNMMIHYTLEVARQKGCYKAALSSNLKRERAHAFYESLGFERHGYSFRVSIQRSGDQ